MADTITYFKHRLDNFDFQTTLSFKLVEGASN
jgi:hypothetical protein